MHDRVAIVTAAAKNLGRTIALTLAESGWNLVASTRASIGDAEAVADEARTHGVQAIAVRADVRDQESISDMVTRATELGSPTLLVNNAALRNRKLLADMSFEEWRAVQDVIVDGTYRCSRTVLAHLTAGGRIINILGANALRGDAERTHVSAAKYGVLGFTRALAAECVEQGITVNAVSPAHMSSEAGRRTVADVVAYLASPEARGVTGQVIEASGLDPA